VDEKITRIYRVVVEPDAEDGGYFAYAPSVPGVAEQGETVEEAFDNMRVALEFHLDSMLEEGEEVPPSDHESGRLERDLELAF
jgi:predicted RNase H-like HicB family nuclease